ncbi:MAG: hypothetical protein AAF483_06525, partial [Planctomycetota bacterium]
MRLRSRMDQSSLGQQKTTEKPLHSLTEDDFNSVCPPGSTVCFYPIFINGQPNPKYRQKTQTIGKAIFKGTTKGSRALAVQIDGRTSFVSVGSIRLCRRYWVKVKRPRRANHWVMDEFDDLELEELRA